MSKTWRFRWYTLLGLAMASTLSIAWGIFTYGVTLVTLVQALLIFCLLAVGMLFAHAMDHEDTQRELALSIAQHLSRNLELGELFDTIVHTILHLVPRADKCVIHLLDESGRRLFARHTSEADRDQAVGMPLGKGIAGRALQERRTRVVADVRNEPDFLPLDSSSNLRALMVAPLHVEGKLLGTISLNSKTPNAFSNADVKLVTLLATQASAALYQNQLYTEARQEMGYVEAIIDNLNDGLVLLDRQRRVLRYNPSLAHILGADVRNIIGQRVDPTSDHPALRRLSTLLDLPSDDPGTDLERRVELDEPLHAVLRVRVSPVRSSNGDVAYIVVLCDDTETLDQIRAGQELIALVSREIRSALDIIRGYATLARTAPSDGDAGAMADWLARIHNESARLWRLGQNLDDLHQAMTGKWETLREPLSLQEFLIDFQEELAAEMRRRKVTFDVRYPPHLATVELDGARLWRMLYTLVDYALSRAVEKGRIVLDVQTNLEDVVLILTDDGLPMSPGLRQRILYGQLCTLNDTDDAPNGAELALGIACRLAQAQGGHLWMPEHENDRTELRLIMPLT
jgi:two-component system, OmpR family, phosphate regulon sensor histidine kinase PhoR